MRLTLLTVPSLCLALLAGAGCSRPDPPGISTEAPPPASVEPANERSVWASLRLAAGSSLPALLKAEVEKAKQKNLKPVVYLGATWCKPCVAIKKYQRDPLMLDAFSGTYIIDIDIDEWKAPDLKPLGFNAGVVPYFYMVDGEGRSTGRTITSSVWGEDIPVNMAPPLKAFFLLQ
ncbi:MAG TPA: thioredoxin family protein [Polyangiaceae bacterium]|jgi:thiol-disulfide isomerase/thioredoxin|nr:thioredoxin family protein [Polyangiaceae bacterium]